MLMMMMMMMTSVCNVWGCVKCCTFQL